MKKTLYVFEDSCQGYFGGGQKVTLDVLEILGVQYDEIVIFDYGRSYFIEKANSINENIKCVYLKRPSSWSFLGSVAINWYVLIKFLFNRSRGDFYVTTKLGLLYTPIIRMLGGKLVYHLHNIENRRRFSLYGIVLRMLAFYDSILCVSESVERAVKKVIGDRSQLLVLYNAIRDVNQIDKNGFESNSEKLKLVYVGSLFKFKGVECLVNALNSPSLTGKVSLSVYGEGPEKTYLQNLAASNVNIEIKGFCEDVRSELIRYDVLVLPTIIEEACPMVLLEAYSVGKPVIVGNLGGQLELLQKAGVGWSYEVGNLGSLTLLLEDIVAGKNWNNIDKEKLNYRYKKEFAFKSFSKKVLEVFS